VPALVNPTASACSWTIANGPVLLGHQPRAVNALAVLLNELAAFVLVDRQGNAVREMPAAGEIIEDKENLEDLKDKASRLVRGGSFADHESNVRCADRGRFEPAVRLAAVGFRPARTFTP
jgi:hypothetical protein